MKTIPLLLLATFALSSLSHADQSISYPKASAQVILTAPDGWTVQDNGTSLSLLPAAGDTSLRLTVSSLKTPTNKLDAAITEAKATLAGIQGITLGSVQTSSSNNLGLSTLEGTGTSDQGKVIVKLILIAKPGSANFFLLSSLATEEGSSKHGTAAGSIIQTLKAATVLVPPSS